MPATRTPHASKESDEHLSVASKSPPSSGSYSRSKVLAWFLYAADWITVVIVVATAIVILIPKPLTMKFLVTDASIQQVYHNDRVSIDRICVVLTTSIPTVIIMLWMGYRRAKLNELHQAILGLALSISLCTLFTSIFKQMGAIPSPDFLDLCRLPQEDFDRAYRTGASISFHQCQNKDINHEMREFPLFSVTISSCGMAYLSLFASVQLGHQLHPEVRRRLKALSPDGRLARSRPGQALISFICLLPVGAGMTFPGIETRYHGGGRGWGYALSIFVGYLFALWGHVLYCYDLTTGLVLPP
ncbi:phosphatidate phosphatase, partial [Coemansia aciculifera]